MTDPEPRLRVWFTDRKGRVYSEEEWDELVTDRRRRWRAMIQGGQALAYTVAFMTGGTALFVVEAENRGSLGTIGGIAFALGIGLTLGSRDHGEPAHRTTFSQATKSGPDASDV